MGSSVLVNERKSSRDGEELVDEDEQSASFLIVAEDYERWSSYRRVAHTYTACVQMFFDKCRESNFQILPQESL